MKKRDVCLAVVLLAVSAALFLGYRFWNGGRGYQAVVRVGDQEYARLSLQEDQELLIVGRDGGTNRLVIKKGRADVTEASCPDKICVHQNPVSQIGETIVCMPNQIVVTIEGENQE